MSDAYDDDGTLPPVTRAPDTAPPPRPVAAMAVAGLSRSGDVEVSVVGGDVTAVHFHPAWRQEVAVEVMQRDFADAVNAGLRAYTGAVVDAVNRDRSDAPGLSLHLRDVQTAVADNRPLSQAVAQLADVIRTIEQQGFPVDPYPPTPPGRTTASAGGGGVTVEVDGGQVTRVALDPEWLLEAGDDLLAATVAAAATRAVRDYLANQLEAQISGTAGADGTASALYQAQAYVASTLAMQLEGVRR